MSQSRGVLLLSYALLLLFLACRVAADDDLQLEHLSVVFRHGDRVPELFPQRFPNDPYMSNGSAFPMGSGGLTKEGKARMYGLGELLRERYHDYLGEYDERRLYAVSSDMPRTKMSLQLVLAALYKPSLHPKSKWHSQLDWQPIPTTYYHFKDDKTFGQDMCPLFLEEFQKVYKSDEVQNELKSYESYMENVRLLIGKKSRVTLNDINILHNNLDLERRLNLTMKPWMINLLEEGTLTKLRVYSYKIRGHNEVLRRNAVGYLFRLITEDLQKARNKTAGHERKVSLYSGHDKNLINLLQAFNLYDSQLPEFGSALLFELFSNNHQQNYFVKISYYLSIPEVIETLTIPGCATLCPLDDFLRLTKNMVATDKEKNCTILADTYFSPID